MIIAIDKHFNECEFSSAAWKRCPNQKDYIVFRSKLDLEQFWRTKHPGRNGNKRRK